MLEVPIEVGTWIINAGIGLSILWLLYMINEKLLMILRELYVIEMKQKGG